MKKDLSSINKALDYLKESAEDIISEINILCPLGGIRECNTLESCCEYHRVCSLVKKYYNEELDNVQLEDISEFAQIVYKLEDVNNRKTIDEMIQMRFCPYHDEVECDPACMENNTAESCEYAALCEMLTSYNILSEAEKKNIACEREAIKEIASSEGIKMIRNNHEEVKQLIDERRKKLEKREKENQLLYF